MSEDLGSIVREAFELTTRQEEVLVLLLAGRNEAQIAKRLGISKHTVHTHVRLIYAKLRVRSRAQLFGRVFDEIA